MIKVTFDFKSTFYKNTLLDDKANKGNFLEEAWGGGKIRIDRTSYASQRENPEKY